MKRPREAAGDIVLRFREVCAVGLEPVGPNVRAVFGIDSSTLSWTWSPARRTLPSRI
jgi:hypothetical protein